MFDILNCSLANSWFFLYSNPSLRVAYIDEVEERESGGAQKVYYSVLVKGVDNLDQVTILINCKQSNLSLLQCHNCWLLFIFFEGNLSNKIAWDSKVRRRKAWKSESRYSFYSWRSSSDHWYESGKAIKVCNYQSSSNFFSRSNDILLQLFLGQLLGRSIQNA